MIIQVDGWNLIIGLCGLIAAISSAAWAFGRVVVGQFSIGLNHRFNAMERSISDLKAAISDEYEDLRSGWERRFDEVRKVSDDNGRELLRLRAELPNDYVRREDWIRFSGTLDSKLDSLRASIDNLRESTRARD